MPLAAAEECARVCWQSMPAAVEECRALLSAAKRNCTGTCAQCTASLDAVALRCVDSGCQLANSTEGSSFLAAYNKYRLLTIGEQCSVPSHQYSTINDVDCGHDVRAPPLPSPPRLLLGCRPPAAVRAKGK